MESQTPLEILRVMKKDLGIKTYSEFCDMIVNAERHNRRYEQWATDENVKESFGTLGDLHRAVEYTFEKKGVVTPHNQAILAEQLQVSEEDVSKGIYPILQQLDLVKAEGKKFRLTPKAWNSVRK
jgi:hypothetical protein